MLVHLIIYLFIGFIYAVYAISKRNQTDRHTFKIVLGALAMMVIWSFLAMLALFEVIEED